MSGLPLGSNVVSTEDITTPPFCEPSGSEDVVIREIALFGALGSRRSRMADFAYGAVTRFGSGSYEMPLQ